VLTIEGLGDDHPMAHAFMDEVGAQCGICTPGMILAAVALGEHPSPARIRSGLAGNLCRCTGYEAIFRAIERVRRGDGKRVAGERSARRDRASVDAAPGAS
jgi:carbon-monoxide dehydrogenase small subunit/xanthine dehydrogenase small subunit